MLLFSLTTIKSQKEPSRFFLFSWVTIDGYKTGIFYNNKNSYAPLKELTTHLLEKKITINKNPIPLTRCTTQFRESKGIDHITIIINQFKYIDI